MRGLKAKPVVCIGMKLKLTSVRQQRSKKTCWTKKGERESSTFERAKLRNFTTHHEPFLFAHRCTYISKIYSCRRSLSIRATTTASAQINVIEESLIDRLLLTCFKLVIPCRYDASSTFFIRYNPHRITLCVLVELDRCQILASRRYFRFRDLLNWLRV